MEKKYFVYILECADGSYYIGKAENVDKRVRAHNGEYSGGAKYTRSRRPVTVKYVEECESISDALKREYMLKKLSRKQKEKLIYQNI